MNEITINRGSDVTLTGSWRDETGEPMDLRDWNISAFQPHPSISGMTVEWLDASTARYRVYIEWSDQIPHGKMAGFRLRISKDNAEVSSPKIWINVT
ncbi:hypothetical protein ACLBKU_17400 [Erythrobacter sp. NE805]|uniref:hypothetical protein n=1 Tax=Erythrobacter sp. NE805 TaxID=3389875 RepID=UPI00396B0E6A